MPVALSYPGVYIEEIPSGVRTITGVATSITAFVGWAPKGPTDSAGLVLSWPDFVRQYGGLDARSYLGYAVSHFFANGGQQAFIVRLVNTESRAAGNGKPELVAAAAAAVTLDSSAAKKLTLTAVNPGDWAKYYGIGIKQKTGDKTRFLLQVVYVDPNTSAKTVVESFEDLSMNADDRRYVEKVINDGSNIIKIKSGDVVGEDPPSNVDITKDSPKMLEGGDAGTVLEPDTAEFESALAPDLPAGSPAGSLPTGGIYNLDHVDLFNLLCVPGETTPAIVQGKLQKYCRDRRAFLIADCAETDTFSTLINGPNSALTGSDSINSAFYFPWLNAPDPLSQNRPKKVPPCGFVAGIHARTDGSRGVWKAAAGTEASLSGAIGVTVALNDPENGRLNPLAVNCIRNFNVYGTVVWGARTLQGNDEVGSEWKYIPVRRTALFIEESLFRGLKWVVFEPNDEPLWAQIRLNVGAFMHNLFRQGAFQGKTPQEAYFVKCDKETTTQNDINLGIVNIVVGFAPLKPAEFVVIQIQQMAGQIAT